MKIAVKLTLFLFLVFLSTPTIVSVIEKSCDTSVFFSMSEEELSHKEVKAELHSEIISPFLIALCEMSPILDGQSLIHDTVSFKIVIPPPETV